MFFISLRVDNPVDKMIGFFLLQNSLITGYAVRSPDQFCKSLSIYQSILNYLHPKLMKGKFFPFYKFLILNVVFCQFKLVKMFKSFSD